MWTNLHLRHFKCFEDANVPLAPLTLLSGLNAAGKSTIIQAFAVLNQTILESDWSQVLYLNGENVSLGTTEDVVNRTTGRRSFGVGLSTKDWSCEWEASSAKRKDELSPRISRVKLTRGKRRSIEWEAGHKEQKVASLIKPMFRLLPTDFHKKYFEVADEVSNALSKAKYLSAERIGPRETYAVTARGDFSSVGPQGEWTPHFLHEFGEGSANSALTWNRTDTTIIKTVESWMDSFFPGFGLQITPIEGANLVTLRIRTSKSSTFLRPQNVGYGLTHVLPIITLCVGSRKGDTLLLENPETHLHPAGQSAIGEFLARTASSDVQVLVETHSDHVLNGIRKAIVNGVLKPKDALFNFVSANPSNDKTVHHSVDALISDKRGRIDKWPPKFFDQFEHDLLELP